MIQRKGANQKNEEQSNIKTEISVTKRKNKLYN